MTPVSTQQGSASGKAPVFRAISSDEISRLEIQGCRCRDWSLVAVEEPFFPDCYRNVLFSGKVTLGSAGDFKDNDPRDGKGPTEGSHGVIAGLPRRCGIYDAVVADCAIGRDVFISNVRGGLLNLDIERGAVIDSVYSIVCQGESCFGNDVDVNVMSETGGREVKASVAMTAPLAYLIAFHRHNALFSKALSRMTERFATNKRSGRGHIGPEAEIVGCGELTDVDIRGRAVIRGAARLKNGTVCEAFVGCGVIAEDFIIQDGAKVDSAARLHGCLVGHCAEVSSGFTAHDTLVFTNSRLENGESAAAFCGPFTTSMHKSTLLIGGLFSFFNAGSGTNQSNHMYKLGPIHQGLLARGCRTGSDSYMMWPAAIGAFTTVTGRHYTHPDTRRFPFSYLVNDPSARAGCASVLIPAAATGSVGLARDVDKWPSRIGGAAQDDMVNFNWLSPFTVGWILKSLPELEALKEQPESGFRNGEDCAGERPETGGTEGEYIVLDGFLVPRRSLSRGIERYRLLVSLFTAGVFRRKILAVIATNPETTPGNLLERLRQEPPEEGSGRWVDLCGMLAPREAIDGIAEEVVAGPEMTLADVNSRLREIHDRYSYYSWNWAWHNLQSAAGIDFSRMTPGELSSLLRRGVEAARELEAIFVADAAKEFDPSRASLGFGIDAGDDSREVFDDFDRVRGSLSSQRFLSMLHRRVEVFAGSLRNIIHLLGEEGNNACR